MATIRVEHTKNYTVMSNHHLRNKELSLKAKGLLSYMLSLPDDWDYTISGLATSCKDGVDSIRSTIAELENAGYMKRSRLRSENGTYGGTEYIVMEYPVVDKPKQENPIQVNPTQENLPQINNNIPSTNKRNTNLTKNPTYPPTEEKQDYGFGPELSEAFSDWLTYKQEKREPYKPTGLKSLVTQIRNNVQKYGEHSVACLIRECMASNWKGIIWERIEKQAYPQSNNGKPVPEPTPSRKSISSSPEALDQIRQDRERMERYRKKLQKEMNGTE